jgi:colanic acid biosynthesis glycosyl transferase WcaI
LKILILSQYFYPENFRINDIAKNLVKNGHNVTVITGLPNYPDGEFFDGYGFFKKNKTENYHGVKVVRCSIYPRKNGSTINLILNYLSYAFSASVKTLSLRKSNFDISLAFAVSPITVVLPGIFLKYIKATPLVTWVQDLWPESVVAASSLKNRFILSLIEKLVIYIYKNTDKILVSSKGMIDSIISKKVHRSKISYLPQWAEGVFEKNVITRNVSITFPRGFRVVFAGNIGFAQDIPSILKAAKILKFEKDIHFIFIGSGSMRAWLSENIKKNGLSDSVHLFGSFPLEDMPYFYDQSDALLVSLGNKSIWSITVPGKVQSYLTSGKPILSMMDGEGSKLIKEANAGLITSSGDYIGLSKNIKKIKSFKQRERCKMGENGKIFYNKNFTKNILMEKLISLLSLEIKK